MRFNMKNSALMVLSVALLGSCKKEDPVTGVTQTLDCDFFKENRTLVDDPDASIDYLVTCDMAVEADITVMPGVVIAFATDAGINIKESGSFNAEGTADAPITFQGEDAIAGSWRGIINYSSDPKNKFDHCVVNHAGGIAHNSNNDRGAFVLWAESRTSITNSSIRNSGAHGINAVYGDAQIVLGGNSITDNAMSPLYIDPSYVGVPDPTDNYQGNGEDRVVLVVYTRGVSDNATWRKVNVPYRVSNDRGTRMKIQANVTVEPGVSAYFDAGCHLYVEDTRSLNAQGTASEPIRFMGTVAAPGSWGGIYFNTTSSPLNNIAHAVIQHAGDPDFPGAIHMWASPVLTVHDVAFSDLGSCAMYASPSTSSPNANLTQYDNTFSNVQGEVCGD